MNYYTPSPTNNKAQLERAKVEFNTEKRKNELGPPLRMLQPHLKEITSLRLFTVINICAQTWSNKSLNFNQF